MQKVRKLASSPQLWLVLVQWVIALQWLKSGTLKFINSDFMLNIDQTISTIVTSSTHTWYAEFLRTMDAHTWGNVTRFSELAIGLVILLCGWQILNRVKWSSNLLVLLTVALYGGAILNLNFYFAAGWGGQAVVGINMVMGLVQFILGTHYFVALKKTR